MNSEKSQISNIVSFFRTVCNLKKIKRVGWIHKLDIDLPESVDVGVEPSANLSTVSLSEAGDQSAE